MKVKSYNFGQVDYGYSLQSKKWEFRPNNGSHTILLPAPGGAVTAHKIARQINGAIKRAGFYDNLARAHVSNLVNQ